MSNTENLGQISVKRLTTEFFTRKGHLGGGGVSVLLLRTT